MLLTLLVILFPASNPDLEIKNGKIVDLLPYSPPFETHADWMDFLAGKSLNPDQLNQFSQSFPEDMFKELQEAQSAEVLRMTYISDGLKIRGFMARPKNVNQPCPVIIYNRGGVMQWGKILLSDLLEFQRLASNGYIVLASNYRGTQGSEGKEEMGGGDIRDILSLIDTIDQMPQADPQNIFMWGFSRGGASTLMALTKTTRVKAAIVQGAPVDLLNFFRKAEFEEHVFPFVVPNYAENPDTALKSISAIYWVEKINATPLLILHSQNDQRVQVEDALRLATKLQEFKRPFSLKIFEGGSHSMWERQDEVRYEVDQWFKKWGTK